MYFVPWCKFNLKTQLSKKEIEIKLTRNMEKVDKIHNHYTMTYFAGFINKEKYDFEIYKIYYGRTPLVPIYRGNIRKTDSGSIINISVDIEKGAKNFWYFMIAYGLFLDLIFSIPLYEFPIPIMLIFAYLPFVLIFNYNVNKVKKKLKSIINK